MVTTKYIQDLKLLNLNNIIKIDPNAKNYISWKFLNKNFKETIEFIGKIITDEQFEYEFPSNENYWSKNAPISFSHYPYFGCELFKSKDSEIYYIVYTDFGGNVPEERCRLLQKELIVM